MARKYAITSIDGIKGGITTHVNGEVVPPGDLLPDDASSFDITYWYYPTPVDIAAGAPPGVRINVTIYDIPYSASNADVRQAILAARRQNRENESFGSENAAIYTG